VKNLRGDSLLKFNVFTLSTVATVLEAFPFLLAGSILGAIIENYLPAKLFQKKVFQRKFPGLLLSLLMGFVLPTCECGVIPIARKLVKKGLPPYLAVTYMFSAPVINPIVIVATYVAFRFNLWMVLGRVGISALAAIVVGLVLSSQKSNIFLDNGKDEDCHHHHHDEGKDCAGHTENETLWGKILSVVSHASEEFLEMSKYLILGALLSSAFRVFVPKSIMMFFEPNLLLSILFMMVLAVLLSICSQADGFVASSFMRFSPFSQLAFVTIGPVVDLKLLLMYSGTFKKKAIVLITVLPFVLIFLVCNLLGLILR
jgi:uncharacterized membrane protein YraQ (UPF0718 family)